MLLQTLVRLGIYNDVVKAINASGTKIKFDRALILHEAIANKTWHPVGHFPELEDQITSTRADHKGLSPDRLDSSVHSLAELKQSAAVPVVDVAEHVGETITGDPMTRQW